MSEFSAARFRARRLVVNLTREQVASDTDLSGAVIAQIERGEIRPSVMALGRLASALTCPVRDLFDAETDLIDLPTELGATVDAWIAEALATAPPMSAAAGHRVSQVLFGSPATAA